MENTMELIEALMEDKEYKSILDSFITDGGYTREDALSMLVALSLIETGKSEKAKEILSSIEKNNSEKATFLYYKGLSIYKLTEDMENREEKILALADAKSLMLSAVEKGLYGEMGENAVKIMMLIEDELDDILGDEE